MPVWAVVVAICVWLLLSAWGYRTTMGTAKMTLIILRGILALSILGLWSFGSSGG